MLEGYMHLANLVLDFLVLVFVISGVAKLLDRLLFKHTLMMLPFMTGGLARLTSVMLPTGELLLALALYCNFKMAKLAAVALLLSFSAVAFAVRRRNIPCRCFGSIGGQTLSGHTVLKNAFLIALIGMTAWLDSRVAGVESLACIATMMVFGVAITKGVQNYKTITMLRIEGYLL
jgi:hypothetical protein